MRISGRRYGVCDTRMRGTEAGYAVPGTVLTGRRASFSGQHPLPAYAFDTRIFLRAPYPYLPTRSMRVLDYALDTPCLVLRQRMLVRRIADIEKGVRDLRIVSFLPAYT